ncbi:MAG: OmpA family protein [Proteobacteria bacterium]|nr:OmpA family protein [Pseudomonadota bacterium]
MKMISKNSRNRGKAIQARTATVVLTILSNLLTPVTQANVVGSDMQLFNPTTDGLDFVTVESSETLLPGYVNFGLFMNYAVNTLPYFEKTNENQNRSKFNDTILAADLNVGIGIAKNLSVGLSLPQVLTQSVSTEGYHGKFRDNGNTEIRLNTKLRLIGDQDGGIAIGGVANINRTKDNPYVGDPARPIFTAQLIGDKKVSSALTLGLNIGYRWRNPGEALPESAPIKPIENQVIASTAAAYHFVDYDTKIILEVYGSQPSSKTDTNTDRTASSSEALLGVKHDIDHNMAVHGGFGTELQHGLSSPDWRIYAGVNYMMGPNAEEQKRVTIDEKPPVKAANPFVGPPKAYERVIVHDILFEFDSAEKMVGPSKDTIAQLAKYLTLPPLYTKLVVTGHTDSIGPSEYNNNLSRNRAETIRKWLISHHNMDAGKIVAEGKGESEPVSSNANYQGRQLNRRVEFKIYRDQKVEKFDPKKIEVKKP